MVDMAQGFYSLYAYTNVVESDLVGHSIEPLLRIVPLAGKYECGRVTVVLHFRRRKPSIFET